MLSHFSMTSGRTLLLLAGMLAVSFCTGCDKSESSNSPAAANYVVSQEDEVDCIIETFAAMNEARSKLKKMGDAAIPVLRAKLGERDSDHHAIGGMLIELGGIGSERALELLAEALAGKTAMEEVQASMYVRAFVGKYRWDSSRLHQVNGLVSAAIAFLDKHRNSVGTKLVARLRLEEALPILQDMRLSADADLLDAIDIAVVQINGEPDQLSTE